MPGGDLPTGNTAKCPSKFPAGVKQALADQRKMLKARKAELKRWNKDDQKKFKTYFGTTDEGARKQMLDRIDKELALNKKVKPENFKRASPEKDSRFAYVYPNDKDHHIYLDKAFDRAPAVGKDSKAGTLCHEMSHFKDIGGTHDHKYGRKKALDLATTDPAKAQDNADNFEYYCEAS